MNIYTNFVPFLWFNLKMFRLIQFRKASSKDVNKQTLHYFFPLTYWYSLTSLAFGKALLTVGKCGKSIFFFFFLRVKDISHVKENIRSIGTNLKLSLGNPNLLINSKNPEVSVERWELEVVVRVVLVNAISTELCTCCAPYRRIVFIILWKNAVAELKYSESSCFITEFERFAWGKRHSFKAAFREHPLNTLCCDSYCSLAVHIERHTKEQLR